MRYLLDTNTCIAAMRNHRGVVDRMRGELPGECAISAITSYELLTGVEKCGKPEVEGPKVRLLIQSLSELAFDAVAAEHAARIRARLESQGTPIGPYDLLIAGQAVSAGLVLVTNNTREFSRIAGITLEDWFKTRTE